MTKKDIINRAILSGELVKIDDSESLAYYRVVVSVWNRTQKKENRRSLVPAVGKHMWKLEKRSPDSNFEKAVKTYLTDDLLSAEQAKEIRTEFSEAINSLNSRTI